MFIKSFKEMMKEVHITAIDKGWWNKDVDEGVSIALTHSELSEGLEALRTDKQSDKILGFKGIEEELADVVIRCMDYAESKGYRLAEAVVKKSEYNKSRPYKHGGKKF